LLQNLKKATANIRFCQQLFQRLFVGQGGEQLLILQGYRIEPLALLRRQGISGKAAQEMFQFVISHAVLSVPVVTPSLTSDRTCSFPSAAHQTQYLCAVARVRV
jgi:hypothetical protein